MAVFKRKLRIINQKPKRVNTETLKSSHKGIRGFYEGLLRRFKVVTQVLTLLPLYIVGSVCIGLALLPGIYTFQVLTQFVAETPYFIQIFMIGFSLALGYFLLGFSLLFILPAFNFIFRAYPKPHRGPYFSVEFLSWYIHNGLTYIMRYSFLEFITPTPFNVLFYKMMGMKVGRGTQINSSNLSDPCLIELGKRVTVGGSAHITAHYGQGGFLVLATTKIGDNVTLGMKCTIMGGVQIGNDVKVLPNSVVLPKTVIPAGEIWGGVPAVKIS